MQTNDYLMYSAGYCSWCDKAKELLSSRGIPFDVVDITHSGSRDEFRQLGHKTIPQIYKNGVLIGGFEALKSHLEAK